MRVSSEPRMVPTVRLTFRMGSRMSAARGAQGHRAAARASSRRETFRGHGPGRPPSGRRPPARPAAGGGWKTNRGRGLSSGRPPCGHRGGRAADHLVHRAEAQARHVLANLRSEMEEGLDELGLALELGAELRVLGAMPTGHVLVADAHLDAAHDHGGAVERSRIPRRQEGRDDDVAPGLQLPVRLDDDQSELVLTSTCWGLGEASSHGAAM